MRYIKSKGRDLYRMEEQANSIEEVDAEDLNFEFNLEGSSNSIRAIESFDCMEGMNLVTIYNIPVNINSVQEFESIGGGKVEVLPDKNNIIDNDRNIYSFIFSCKEERIVDVRLDFTFSHK